MDPHAFRILALSDLHGASFKEASDLIDDLRPDWIVLLGDLLPDFPRLPGLDSRLQAQREFWETYRSRFVRDWAFTTLVRGNHEIEGFSDPLLQRVPQELKGQVLRLEGIPIESGAWGWSREWEEEELEEELAAQLRDNPTPRIILSHVPPYGCLDRASHGERIGHRPLARLLRKRGWSETLVLCGHVHEAFGHMEDHGATIVNVAGGYGLLEWRLGTTTLLGKGRLTQT